MITQERADILTKILESDEQRAKNLLSLEASEALAQINALGNDFTLDELKAYGKALNNVISAENGELDIDQLSEVSGGIALLPNILINIPKTDCFPPYTRWVKF